MCEVSRVLSVRDVVPTVRRLVEEHPENDSRILATAGATAASPFVLNHGVPR